ncbi:hypothetical protein K443DRAFT_8150 [Laccaria amethystina LaAM-08-1]|uniref:Uncharacterized protein n=1 Tax=Laccaria amethystina LaAM-08-1 TaxID=1095629 RepID=A0A0C9WP98_9AGAR|nr:hypothetical protein K443DRAFT_8150 [Laccaria amethystina LaAM-08-1]
MDRTWHNSLFHRPVSSFLFSGTDRYFRAFLLLFVDIVILTLCLCQPPLHRSPAPRCFGFLFNSSYFLRQTSISEYPPTHRTTNRRDENEEAEVELEEDEADEWKWEEVLTVAHVWLEGERGIIYHHSRTTQVYITLNTNTIPRRKGVSNVPFVFTAPGRVHLSPTPFPSLNFPPPLKSKQVATKPKEAPVKSVSRRVPSSKLSRESRRTLADIETDGNSDSGFEPTRPFDENHPFVTSNYDDEITSESEVEEDDSDGEENIDAALNPDKWIEEDAFEHYLAWFMCPPPDAEEDKENSCTSVMSTPGLTLSSSPGIPSSSSSLRSSSRPSSAFGLYPPSSFPLSDHYPNTKYKCTPVPSIARVARMGIEGVQKRMEKAKQGDALQTSERE